MKRLAIPLLVLALGAAGCVDKTSNVQVFQVCSIPDDDCAFDATCGAGYIGEVRLDVAVQDRLWLVVQVNNQRATSEDFDTGDAFVDGYDTEYEAPAGFVAPPTSGAIQATIPSDGTATMSVFPITSSLGTQLRLQVAASTPTAPTYVDLMAKLRLKGQYGDGSRFESSEFRIPVRVCRGCSGLTCVPASSATCPPESPAQLPTRVDICGTPAPNP